MKVIKSNQPGRSKIVVIDSRSLTNGNVLWFSLAKYLVIVIEYLEVDVNGAEILYYSNTVSGLIIFK
jgi:hypothetical protein